MIKEIFEKYKKRFFEMLNIVEYNAKSVILFVFLFAVFNVLACCAVFFIAKKLVNMATGITYLGPDNMFSILLNPAIIIMCLMTAILLSVFAIFEISGIIYAHTMSIYKEKVTLGKMINVGLRICKKGLFIENWSVFLFVIIILPLTNFVTFSSSSISVVIPTFIIDFLMANKTYYIILITVYILLLIYVLHRIFAFNFYIFKKNTFKMACKESIKLTKGKFVEIIFCILLSSFAFYLFSITISALGSELAVKLSAFINRTNGTITNTYNFSRYMPMLKKFINAVFSPIFNLCILTMLFYKYTSENESITKNYFETLANEKFIFSNKLLFVAVLVFVSVVSIFTFSGAVNALMAENNIPKIGAHRGDSVRAPENTMPAFEIAVSEFEILGEESWIELDVHETKDGQILISHDDDLKRVTGKDVYMHELTFDEARSLDVGSWFDKKFSNVRFSTLDEFLKFVKPYENVKVQVEIKPTEYDVEIEEKVVKIINENGMHDRCVVASLQLKPLLRVKEIDSMIKTAYIMFVAWDSIYDIENVDYFSVETNNVTPELVHNIHKLGKECYVWTVNDEESVQDLIDYGVDCILTDDPVMMFDIMLKADYSGGIVKVFRYFLDILLEGF